MKSWVFKYVVSLVCSIRQSVGNSSMRNVPTITRYRPSLMSPRFHGDKVFIDFPEFQKGKITYTRGFVA